jgi:hypothetical protein
LVQSAASAASITVATEAPPTLEPTVTPPSDPTSPRWLFWALLALFACSLIYYLWAASIGINNTLYSDRHAFRQTQTALGCFYMLKDGLTLKYQTPVLGAPWSLPFEFPLYQWAVVGAVKLFHAGLDPTGRAVSIAFFLLTLIPCYLVLPALGVRREHRLLFPILLLVSPFYVFWSRTFMMETTALFFSSAYAACFILYVWKRQRQVPIAKVAHWAALAVLFGALAALVKITTFMTFGLATVIYLARGWFTWPLPKPNWAASWRPIGLLAIAGGIPLAIGLAWTGYADSIKAQHPISSLTQISTLPAQRTWNFGTWTKTSPEIAAKLGTSPEIAAKLDISTWERILGNAGSLIHYDAALWAGCLAIAIVTRRRWKQVLACVVLYLSAPLAFTNVHWIHDYYQCANGIFLLMAVGFCILSLFELPRVVAAPRAAAAGAGLAALLVVITAAVIGYMRICYPLQSHNDTRMSDLAYQISSRCDPDAVVVYVGLDWDPTLPYYTRRRALMIPDWPELTESAVHKAIYNLVGYKIGGLFINRPARNIRPQFVYDTMVSAGIPPPPLHAYIVNDKGQLEVH